MRLLATLKIAARALRRNTLRTILTMLGIIIGVGAVIAMVSIGSGAKAQVESRIAALGQNVVQVFSGSSRRGGISMGWGSAGTLAVEDADAIEREVAGVIGVSPEVRSGGQASYGNMNWQTSVNGVSPDYLNIRQWKLQDGAMFTEADVRSAAKVAVIGQTTITKLFNDEEPLGKIVRIKNVPIKVVGTLAPKGMSMFGGDQDDVLFMPYTTVMKRLAGVTTLRSINLQTVSADVMPQVQEDVNVLLRQRHRIQPPNDDDFTVRTQTEIAETATETSQTMTLLLASIAGVSLVVGGIGIMNIMLVSVTERTREIGIRLAVGARGRDILLQFLIEAVTLSVIGGLVGIGLGVGASKILAAKMNWPTLTSFTSILVAFFFSAAVGVFFGFYPARKASDLDPIDALRYE
ncbi:MAG: multidrug ABC transporter substrate-binding protein [Verrucomicrobia bacterium]|nr:MAG: multidrug ABC transporter substrate-binding protein [Verrucomicrobiota bacterium]